jgi:hypothetical protein
MCKHLIFTALFEKAEVSHPNLDTQAKTPYTPTPREGTSYQKKLPIDIPPHAEMEQMSRLLGRWRFSSNKKDKIWLIILKQE